MLRQFNLIENMLCFHNSWCSTISFKFIYKKHVVLPNSWKLMFRWARMSGGGQRAWGRWSLPRLHLTTSTFPLIDLIGPCLILGATVVTPKFRVSLKSAEIDNLGPQMNSSGLGLLDGQTLSWHPTSIFHNNRASQCPYTAKSEKGSGNIRWISPTLEWHFPDPRIPNPRSHLNAFRRDAVISVAFLSKVCA